MSDKARGKKKAVNLEMDLAYLKLISRTLTDFSIHKQSHKLQTKFLCYFSTQRLQTLTKHNQEVELLEYTICSYY